MTEEPERVVYVFVIVEGNKIPFRQRAHSRKTEPDNYGAPAAGHIEIGESQYVAGPRELLEETGIVASQAEFYQGYLGMAPKLATRSPGKPDRYIDGYVFLIDRSGMKAADIKKTPEHSGATLLVDEGELVRLIKEVKDQRLAPLGRSTDRPPQIPMLPPHTDLTNPTKEIMLSRIGDSLCKALHQKAAKTHRSVN